MANELPREKTQPVGLVAVRIASGADVVTARQRGRSLAARIGFNGSELTVIATAISELARNILEYAKVGEIILGMAQRGPRTGIMIVARDEGPGIADLGKAMQDGYSTGKGLGLGLPGVRRLMDDFEISSVVAQGTTVTVKKWIQ
jgi:serine/threonine-protein kinase RsbT